METNLQNLPVDDLARMLNARQRLFVEYYLGETNLNAAKAAKAAGYKDPKNEGYRLLHHNPVIRAYIDARLNQVAMTTSEILYRFAEQARGSIAPFLYYDETADLVNPPTKKEPKGQKPDRRSWNDPEGDEDDGDPLHDDETPAEDISIRLHTRQAKANIHLVKELEVTKTTIEGDQGSKTTAKVKIKLHDAQAANAYLARAAGLFKDSTDQLLKTIDLSKLSTSQLDRLTKGEDILSVLLHNDRDLEEGLQNRNDEPTANATT